MTARSKVNVCPLQKGQSSKVNVDLVKCQSDQVNVQFNSIHFAGQFNVTVGLREKKSGGDGTCDAKLQGQRSPTVLPSEIG